MTSLSGSLILSLWLSAYLCALWVNGYLNAEGAEIRREPQRAAEELTDRVIGR